MEDTRKLHGIRTRNRRRIVDDNSDSVPCWLRSESVQFSDYHEESNQRH